MNFLSLNTVLIAFLKDIGTLPASTSLIFEGLCPFEIFLDTHLLFIDHDEGIEGDAECESCDRVEVDSVLSHFDVVPLSVSFLDLRLVVKQLFLTDWNDRCVTELFNGPEI